MNSQDQIMVSLIGIIGVVVVGTLAHAPILYSLLAGLGVAILIALYARLIAKPNTPSLSQENTPQATLIVSEDYPLAEGFAEPILTIGERGQISYANLAAKKLFARKIIGFPYGRIIRQPAVLAAVQDALQGGMPDPVTYEIEMPIVRHIRVTAAPIKTTSKFTPDQRVLVVFYDITDLVIANTLRSDFLANASHELKTPIASILGYIETLRGHAKNDAEARDRFLIIMQQQAERMQRLITDILSLRRIEQKAHNAPSTRADLYLAAKAARESVAPLAKERGVKISFENKQDLLVKGDQDELVQLVLNLLDNAVQMSPPEAKVRLSFEKISEFHSDAEFLNDLTATGAPQRRIVNVTDTDCGYAIVRIRDQGPGFAKEHLPRIGERFYRIIGDRKSSEKGTGLGLAVVKHIVRRHRGGLFVESAEGVGTEFSIFIPLTSPE